MAPTLMIILLLASALNIRAIIRREGAIRQLRAVIAAAARQPPHERQTHGNTSLAREP
jgi:hypothetical protein